MPGPSASRGPLLWSVRISRSPRAGKKWVAHGTRGAAAAAAAATFTVHFGASGYQDYTQHRDADRMRRYLTRHRAREDWTLRGIATAGFWSRWLLWNRPGLRASAADVARRFRIRVALAAQTERARRDRR